MNTKIKNNNLSNLNQNRVYSIYTTQKFQIVNKNAIIPLNNNININQIKKINFFYKENNILCFPNFDFFFIF